MIKCVSETKESGTQSRENSTSSFHSLWAFFNEHLATHPGDRGEDSVPARSSHWSEYLQGVGILLALVRVPAGCQHAPRTGQSTCRVLACTSHWSEYLQGVDARSSHWSEYLQGVGTLLALVRVPAGCRHAPRTGQSTCRVSARSSHWSEYLQGVGTRLALVRVSAGCRHTPRTGQSTCRVSARASRWSEYLQGVGMRLALVRVPAGWRHAPRTGWDTKEKGCSCQWKLKRSSIRAPRWTLITVRKQIPISYQNMMGFCWKKLTGRNVSIDRNQLEKTTTHCSHMVTRQP